MEELSRVFSVIAVLISFWSAYTVRRLWYQAHRPIVSATVQENSRGGDSAIFDLVIFNSGNRPATEIFLEAKKADIDRILIENTNDEIRNEIYQIFSNSSRIQLLLNNSKTKTAFFGFAANPSNKVHVLEYDAELSIKIKYKDLDGNSYSSKQCLYIRDAEGFGGSVWEKASATKNHVC